MKQSRNLSGTLLIIGLILILSLFFVSQIMTKPNSQVIEKILTPVTSPSPTLSPLLLGSHLLL